jgi:opacity protein-like surface antigen
MNRPRLRLRTDRKDDVMSSLKMLAAAGAASFTFATAQAADLAPIAPFGAPPIPVAQEFSGWYLRGNIGSANETLGSLTNPDPNAQGFSTAGLGFDSAGFFGGGLGYQFNNWLRFDATGEYRGKANFHGSQYMSGPGFALADNYTGSFGGSLFLANVYVDLGTWWCITPFVGGGVGAAYNRISSFQDTGVNTQFGVAQPGSVTYATDSSTWSFAWDLTAGLAYKVTPGFTVELAYRYVNLGSATTGLANVSFDGSFTPPQYAWTMKNIQSNDFMLGVRWNLWEPPAPVAPLIRKG